VLLLVHLLATIAKLLGPGGVKGVVAENLLSSNSGLSAARGNVCPILQPLIEFFLVSAPSSLRPSRIVKNAVARPCCNAELISALLLIRVPSRHATPVRHSKLSHSVQDGAGNFHFGLLTSHGTAA